MSILDIKSRFRGYLPVVVDLETAGFNNQTDALLEVAAVILDFNDQGQLTPVKTVHEHFQPFEGANLQQESLDFTGIDPYNPLRGAVPEIDGLRKIFEPIRAYIKSTSCNRAILVGHNAHFDHGFINAAVVRTQLKRNPFHPFSSLDTATLGAVFYGQTVLAKVCSAAGVEFDAKEAHSAIYDAEKTAEVFCLMVNQLVTLKSLQKTVETAIL